MTTILLVDDEPLVRTTYRAVTDWERHGFTIAADVGSAQEAIEVLMSRPIDILVTDIRMPGTDGLKLIERALSLQPSLAVVALSAHDDFELVRRAFVLGAADYFLKPDSEPEELLETLQKVVATAGRRHPPKADGNARAIAQTDAEVARALRGDARAEAGLRVLREIVPGGGMFAVAVAVQEGTPSSPTPLAELLRHAVAEAGLGRAFADGESHTILIFTSPPPDELHSRTTPASEPPNLHASSPDDRRVQSRTPAAAARLFLDALLLRERKQTGALFSAGISRVHHDLRRAGAAYAEATQALHHRFVFGRGSVISASLLDPTDDSIMRIPMQTVAESAADAVIQAIGTGDTDAVLLELSKLRDYLKSIRVDRDTALHSVYLRLHVRLQVYVREMGFDPQSLLGAGEEYVSTIHRSQTLDEMHEATRTWVLLAIKTVRTPAGEYVGDVVLRVREYIARNFSRPIRLEQIARDLAVNPSYLSRVFSQRVGSTLTKYTNKLRVEKTKEALRSSQATVYQIAVDHGFESAEYFCRVFKRIVGVSPRVYRKGRGASAG